MQKGRHGLCKYSPGVCLGYFIPFRTLYGCIYTNKAWCNSVRFLVMAVEGHKSKTDGSKKHPAFFMSV